MRIARSFLGGVALVLCLAACKRSEEGKAAPKTPLLASAQDKAAVPNAPSVQLARGMAADLRVTPDGRFATYLLETRKPPLQGLPPQMLLGEAYVIATEGGSPARKLGKGVTNMPGGLLLTADSRHVLYLTGFNPANQAGELWSLTLEDPKAEPRRLGESVSYVVASPDGRQVAFVDEGALKLGPLPEGPFQAISGEVSTAQFSPDGETLYVKRQLSAAGGLMAVAVKAPGTPRKLGEQVGDYAISPDSKRVAFQVRSKEVPGTFELHLASQPQLTPLPLAVGTASFVFSADSRWLARNENGKPELLGDLYVGPAAGGAGRKIAERVQDFSFAPDSKAIAYMDKYDLSARAGLMGVAALPDGKPQTLGSRVPNYAWGADSSHVAFLSRFLRPIYSVDLMLYRLGDEKAEKAQAGVFGYSFTPHNEALVFRTACVRNARECELKALPLPRKPQEPELWVKGLFSYRPSEDGQKYLVSFSRLDSDTHDLAIFDLKTHAQKPVDQGVQLPAFFGAKDASKVLYLIGKGPRAGVYVATLTPDA